MSKGRKREKAWKIWTKDGWSREGREGKEGLKEEKNQYDKEWWCLLNFQTGNSPTYAKGRSTREGALSLVLHNSRKTLLYE